MAGERTVPLLPCGAIDEVEDFAVALGFTTTYRQRRPNPAAARRQAAELAAQLGPTA
jgi:hypothetical protein